MGVVSGVVFWVLALVAVGTGVAVFRVDSMARASYALAVSFAAVGLALLLVDLEFIGVITVLMMTMEMAVMAVFMVMFMGMNPALMPMSMTHGTRSPAVIAVGCFLVLASGSVLIPWPTRDGRPGVGPHREPGHRADGVEDAGDARGERRAVHHRGGRALPGCGPYPLRPAGRRPARPPVGPGTGRGRPVTLQTVLLVASALFSVGLYGALSQTVVVMVMMGLELMLNGVILAAAGFWWFVSPSPDGQVLLLVVITAMTVEMAMGFAVATVLHRSRDTDSADSLTDLRG